MENTPASSPSVCKKIRAAITTSPALRVLRYGSFSTQDSNLANDGENYSTLPAKTQAASTSDHEIRRQTPSPQHVKVPADRTETAGVVPVKFDNSMISAAALDRDSDKVKRHNHLKVPPHVEPERPHGKHDINDPFSDYIRRAKMVIRTLTFTGGGSYVPESIDTDENKSKKESTKDHFSDFIHRAKMRIRTTSSRGQGKSNTFKRE